MKGEIVPLYSIPVYHAKDVIDEQWLEKTIDSMSKIGLEEVKVGSETFKKSFFGDDSNDADYGIDTTWLFDKVKEYMLDYLQELHIPHERYDIYVQKWWPVVTSLGGTVAAHTHNNAHFSVVYYVSVPTIVDRDPGSIAFHSPQDHWGNHIGASVSDKGVGESGARFVPTSGDLIIFPSTLKHSVSANEYDIKRMSISLDITLIRNETTSEQSTDEMSLPPLSRWKKL